MSLYSDKVANVRRRLAEMLVRIRNSLYKEHAEDLSLFEMKLIHLASDRDKETARIAQEQHSNLRDIDSFKSDEDC